MAASSSPYYLLQPAFTGGEISEEVANRVDLDKYQYSVLQAYNCLVKPHGPIYRRPGMKFIGRTKYNDKQCILVPFNGEQGTDYLLEIGEQYIRVYKNGEYLNAELVTPYTADILAELRFVQSADTMFIASGKYPVKQLARYSETDWRFSDFEITNMYFDETLATNTTRGTSYMTAGTYSYTVPETGTYTISVAGAGGGGSGVSRKASDKQSDGAYGGRGADSTFQKVLTKDEVYTIVVGEGGAGSECHYGAGWGEAGGKGGTSTAFEVSCQGGEGGGAAYSASYGAKNGTDGTSYGNGGIGGTKGFKNSTSQNGTKGGDGWVIISFDGTNKITPSSTSGEVTLTATQNTFSASSVGTSIKLKQEVATVEVNTSNGTSAQVRVGENWKVISHGTWSGDFEIQKSDGSSGEWKTYRKYTSKDDYNPSESGSVTEPIYLRVVCNVTSGTAKVNLTAMAYNAEGTAKITEYIDEKTVKAITITEFANTEATENYYFGSWSEEFGYPQTLCFFQDRLCFGGTSKQPYMVWMSRTGDYNNFSVEKVSGTVTDDSAVALSFVSRKQFKILHLIASTDLIVLTAGNEWTVSGSDTVTPTKAVPKMQTTRGCSNVEPLMIGGRIIFVQGRGSTVRDMGYSYETDSYGGNDLTLLAKHIIEDLQITDAAYKQEPDSTIYFVRSDGTMACLSYILEQKVYAWSTIETQGNIEAVASVQEGAEDVIYVAVKREINGETVRNIECLAKLPAKSDSPDDYIMLDGAVEFTSETKSGGSTEIFADSLAGATVDVLGDGRIYSKLKVDENGYITLPATVQHAFIGLPYTSIIELPNVEIKTGDGTMQGRRKLISTCIVRLNRSLGGVMGPDANTLDSLSYDELNSVDDIKLFTGDKEMTLPIGGYNLEGRVLIKTDEPYPFNVLAVVREVAFGG